MRFGRVSFELAGDRAAFEEFAKRGTNAEYRALLARLLRRAVTEELTERQRQMTVARYIDGKSQREIARTFGVAPSTVSRTLKRAMRRLSRVMGYAEPVYISDD